MKWTDRIGRRVKLRDLHIALAVADAGSMTGVEPTHYGRALLQSGVAVFDEMRKGLQQIEFIKQPDAGDLRIGSSIVVDAGLLPAILEQFARDFPRAVLHVMHEDIATQQ